MTHPTREEFPHLSEDLVVDVAVIGGGITGLTIATELARKGQKVCVLERQRVGAVTSGANSAHLSTLWDGKFHHLESQFGLETAAGLASAMVEAVSYIRRNSQRAPDRADFKIVPGYFYASHEQDDEEVQKEWETCRRLKLPVRRLDQASLPFPTKTTLEISEQGIFHPLKYLEGLTSALIEAGGKIFENTPVMSTDDFVQTPEGSVKSRHVVWATHTPGGRNVVQTALKSRRSYMMAFRSQHALPVPDGLFWDAADPYNYIRSYGDPHLLLIGGGDYETGRGNPEKSLTEFKAYLHKNWSVQETVAEWSAQYYDSSDEIPLIGQSPFSDSHWIATGFSGDGLTFGTFSGLLLSRLLSGEKDDRSEIFSPSRIQWVTNKEFLQHNLQVGKHFIGDRWPKVTVKPEDLRPGEGTVAQGPLGGTAYFCQAPGELVQMSAVCPHMNCIVHWNSVEQTFDCPCHGSRFYGMGEAIEGPALDGLNSPLRRE